MRTVAATPDIADSTRNFERWLRGHTRLRQHELDYKHEIMAADTFSFLRATFYRWAQLAPQALPDLADAARVLAVGDLHVENFGTWRDVEGRLVWGVNDFDEAYRMPYTFDLVRLATSAGLAASEGQLNIDLKQACAAILAGYKGSLRAGGTPMVLAENDRWLRKMATARLRDPVTFWARMQALPTARGSLPAHLKLCSCTGCRMERGRSDSCGAARVLAAWVASGWSRSPTGMARAWHTRRRRWRLLRGNGRTGITRAGGSSISTWPRRPCAARIR